MRQQLASGAVRAVGGGGGGAVKHFASSWTFTTEFTGGKCENCIVWRHTEAKS